MREPVRVGPSSEYPVSLDTLRAQVRVDGQYDDVLLDVYLQAAVAHVEYRTGRAVAATTWQQSFDGFCTDTIKVPFGPVVAASVSVAYLDINGDAQTIGAEGLLVDASSVEASVSAFSGSWPATDQTAANVTLSWVSQPETCPPELIVAVLMLAAHWYNQREAVVIGTITAEVPMAATALIQSQRRFKG